MRKSQFMWLRTATKWRTVSIHLLICHLVQHVQPLRLASFSPLCHFEPWHRVAAVVLFEVLPHSSNHHWGYQRPFCWRMGPGEKRLQLRRDVRFVGYFKYIPFQLESLYTSSTGQGGGGSFKNRKPIGEIGCCESGVAERIH